MHAQKEELQENKRQSKIALIRQTMRVWVSPQLEPQEDMILEFPLENMLVYRLRCDAAACAYKE